ncbi:MAG: Uma2 family endonuclease [Fimbriimonadales bacterium]|nr:Uma2 family endonuclease [Fimbriimonadales bacterium]
MPTVAAPKPKKTHRRLSWEEYLRWENDLTHYEIIDGEVQELPTPILKHQIVLDELMARLRAFVRGNRLGRLLSAPFDFVVRRKPLRTRQPDLFFLSKAREAEWKPNLNEPRLEVAPDLVIEILSPSDTYRRWKGKLQDYHRLGVQEVWAVDIEAEEIEVLVREADGYRSLGWFSGEQIVATQALMGLELKPSEVFQAAQE